MASQSADLSSKMAGMSIDSNGTAAMSTGSVVSVD